MPEAIVDTPVTTGATESAADTATDSTAVAVDPSAAAPDTSKTPDASVLDLAETTEEVAGDWPEDWREKYAGEDPKALKQLQRYTSPKAALDALFAAQKRISSGELKSSKPKGDSADEVAAWRKENGIPDDPTGYDLTLPDGLVIGADEKPIVDAFVKDMHAANASPELVKTALASYYRMQEEEMIQAHERNEQACTAAVDALRNEWGPDYRRNVNAVKSLLGSAAGDLTEVFAQARLADGTSVLNQPDVMRFLAGMAREINPSHTVVPGAGSNAANAIADEISNLEKMMGDHGSDYWKGPSADKNQTRYRELVAARDRMK